MPKSRRDKTYSLTRTKKKTGLEHKEKVIEQVRNYCNQYERIFVYSLENTRNNHLKELRTVFKDDSRFYQGKNKLTQIALGRTEEEETLPGLHKVSEQLVGEVGLLFTDKKSEEVVKYFNSFNQATFARAGDVSTVTVKIVAGALPQFSHAIESFLREKLKLPTMLKNGVVTLLKDVFLAKDGDRLTPENTRLLKLFGCAIADFNLNLMSRWEKKSGEFGEVKVASTWDKRTYNSIVVEGDDQKWAWLEDGEMKELLKKSKPVDAMDIEREDENENLSAMFE